MNGKVNLIDCFGRQHCFRPKAVDHVFENRDEKSISIAFTSGAKFRFEISLEEFNAMIAEIVAERESSAFRVAPEGESASEDKS